MIAIQNFQFGLSGSTFDVDLDGQTVAGCRTVKVRGQTRVVLPQTASRIDWSEHCLADIEAAVTNILKF